LSNLAKSNGFQNFEKLDNLWIYDNL
jgi:hypothetical protein